MTSKALKIVGAIVVCLVVALGTLRATGFEPTLCVSGGVSWTCRVPGLWLRGDVATAPVEDWSFTDQYPSIKIETRDRLGLPFSLTVWCVASERQLYLVSRYDNDAQYPHGRRWTENVARDPRVRLKVGDTLYERTLVHVTDPGVWAAVIKAQGKKYPTRALTLTPNIHVFHVVDSRASG